jgi:NADPH-dependent F420 reductase
VTTIGFLGGTGPLGRGLALRLAMAGHSVILGSRDADKAERLAAEVRAVAGDGAGTVTGAANEKVATAAEVCFLTVPYDGQQALLEQAAGDLDGKLLVSCVNALAFDGGPHRVVPEAGSAAQEAAALVPGARVVAAFHTVSAPKLEDPARTPDGDVPVCGDDAADRQLVVDLADQIPGLRGVHAGPLHHSGTLEALTALIISVNRLHKASAGVTFTGIDPTRVRA